MNFLLCHGWGFDSSFWQNLTPLLAPHTVYTVDLGYFGNPKPFPTSGTWIGIGHSLGLIKLLQTRLTFSALIGLNSFLNFLGPFSLHERREKELLKMIQSFEKDPEKTLASFYKMCGVDFQVTRDHINKALLLNDLKSLFVDYSELLPPIPCLSLESKNDIIVPLECGLGHYPKVTQPILEEGRHGLGFLYPLEVKAQVTAYLLSQKA